MRDEEFTNWLKLKYPNPNSWKTFRSDTRKICRYEGDLALLQTFYFSKKDGVKPSNTILHNADPYETATFRRQCIKLYAEFYRENPRSLLGSYYPDQVDEEARYFEGAVERVIVNRYERNEAARQKCIDHYGPTCAVCDFDFEAVYGPLGKGYIHVHHLLKISSIGESYEVDPIKDIRPVCPNCHAMLHRKCPAYTIEALRLIINRELD
jgi:hypothetical protein